MKKFKLIVKPLAALTLAALMTSGIFGCKSKNDIQSTPVPNEAAGTVPPVTTLAPNATAAPVKLPEGCSFEFIRISYGENVNSMKPYVIKDTQELRGTLENNMDIERRGEKSVNELLDVYNGEFFKTNYILVFNLTFSSGSTVPMVTDVSYADGKVTVSTDGFMSGDVGTCDMASHMCLLALDSDIYPEDSEFVITGAGLANDTVEK